MPDPYKGHPWIALVVGRRGSGKTYHASEVATRWRQLGSDNGRGLVLGIDPIATDPPRKGHVAASCDLWVPEMPEDIPDAVQLVVVDEADLFAPQADARRRPPPPLVDLVRRGRHRGVSLLLCTQRPALVMRDVFALADSVTICQTTDQRDLDALCSLHGVKEYREQIATTSRPGRILTWTPHAVQLHK